MTAYVTAYIALFAWPLVVIVLFKRLSLQSALIWSILGGYLLLPEIIKINLEVIKINLKKLVKVNKKEIKPIENLLKEKLAQISQ